MKFTKLILATSLLVGSVSAISGELDRGGRTHNWIVGTVLPQWEYVDPCNGYRNNHVQHVEKSVEISNQYGMNATKIKNAYILADAKYRQEEDDYMRKAYPEWFKLSHDVIRRRHNNTMNASYEHGFVGSPNVAVNYGGHYVSPHRKQLDRDIFKAFVKNPPSGFLTMSLYLDPNLSKNLSLPNDNWESNTSTLWYIMETPRTYYRCPREHPLWGKPEWAKMMNCVKNGQCSAYVVPR